MKEIIIERLDEESDIAKDALRTLRTNIRFSGNNIKSILFTSTAPNEGKSTVTFELARSVAQSGKKAVYLDSDIRKAKTVSKLGAYAADGSSILGLSHYLTGQNEMDEIIYKTNEENLFMIFSGPSVPNPTEILDEDRFAALMSKLKEEYDLIVIDTAPLGIVIDAAVTAKYVDGAIVVIEVEKAKKAEIRKVRNQLEQAGVKILGAVLNKVEVRKHGYYYGYYNSTSKKTKA